MRRSKFTEDQIAFTLKQAGPAFVHPTARTAVPMVYVLYDKRHFERVWLPVTGVCPFHDPVAVDWFERRLGGLPTWICDAVSCWTGPDRLPASPDMETPGPKSAGSSGPCSQVG